MRKRSLYSRIAVLNNGQKAYLEFLRNLTPQSVLLIFSILVAHKIFGVNAGTYTGWDMFILVALLTMSFLSFYNNAYIFYKACYKRPLYIFLVRAMRSIKKNSTSPTKKKISMLIIIKRKSVELLEVFLSFIFLQVTLAIVITGAILQANEMYQKSHPTTQVNSTKN